MGRPIKKEVYGENRYIIEIIGVMCVYICGSIDVYIYLYNYICIYLFINRSRRQNQHVPKGLGVPLSPSSKHNNLFTLLSSLSLYGVYNVYPYKLCLIYK